ncbi:hypothetical protein SAMN04488113_102167 [Alkalibacterium gilvum]|uniref:O-antigen ligase like membrane protein n=1 Tax=Alkalibacterium gilvum TaxID=1130080 RepID=A0A1H6RE03_9LACT|nr:hypothetical protein [Alkalibacterium gilvum]SEI54031.1 hypothetical protein SAMN04488113_102167 [Alkalibacterium gilvum]
MNYLVKRYTNMNNSSIKSILNGVILTLLCISFTTFDMMISLISLSEIILVGLLPILLYKTIRYFKYLEWGVIGSVGVFILLITTVQIFFNENFMLKPAVYGSAKIFFYTLVFFSGFTFIKKEKLTLSLIKINNISAMIVIIIGIYINIAIYTDKLPFEFLWTLLRTDDSSYYFRGTENLIRMRSIFNEPAHLGFYLNTILGVNLFNRIRNSNILVNSVLVLGVVLTFSFSSLIIVLISLFIYTIQKIHRKKSLPKPIYMVFTSLMILIVFIFAGDWLELSLVDRLQDITQGKDNSAIERIIGSWKYITLDSTLIGVGIGNAPTLFNNYAYILTEMGFVAITGFVIVTAVIFVNNFGLGMLLLLLNFQKGGYLSASFTLSLLFIMVVLQRNKVKENIINEVK